MREALSFFSLGVDGKKLPIQLYIHQVDFETPALVAHDVSLWLYKWGFSIV